MRKKKSRLLKLIKEAPSSRKERLSSGIRFRAAVFQDKKKESKRKAKLGAHDWKEDSL